MTQEVEVAAAVTTEVFVWIIAVTVWLGLSITIFSISMHKRRKITTFPYATTITILWPLILLIQVMTHILPTIRAVVAFVPRCLSGLRTFGGILIQGTQVTLRGGLPQLPGKRY